MKWEADQRFGWFGWVVGVAGESAQSAHKGVVDIHRAVNESRELMQMFLASHQHPDAPALSGGVLDAWPAAVVDGLAICKVEVARIREFLSSEVRR